MTPAQSRKLDGIAGSEPADDYEATGRILRRRKRHDREQAEPLSDQDRRVQFGHDAQTLNKPLIKAAGL
jgi:hypothetical protein